MNGEENKIPSVFSIIEKRGFIYELFYRMRFGNKCFEADAD